MNVPAWFLPRQFNVRVAPTMQTAGLHGIASSVISIVAEEVRTTFDLKRGSIHCCSFPCPRFGNGIVAFSPFTRRPRLDVIYQEFLGCVRIPSPLRKSRPHSKMLQHDGRRNSYVEASRASACRARIVSHSAGLQLGATRPGLPYCGIYTNESHTRF